MNPIKKRIRMPRAVIVAGCLTALAAPGSAFAMPSHGDSWTAVRAENGPSHVVANAGASDESGARLDHRGLRDSQPHRVLPMSHHAQSSAPAIAERTYALPPGYMTDAQSSAPAKSTPATVTREIRTVSGDNDHTLAIVLASCALGIALCGTGFAAIRLAQIKRRVLGTNS